MHISVNKNDFMYPQSCVMQFENICNKKNNVIADIRSLLIILTVMNF